MTFSLMLREFTECVLGVDLCRGSRCAKMSGLSRADYPGVQKALFGFVKENQKPGELRAQALTFYARHRENCNPKSRNLWILCPRYFHPGYPSEEAGKARSTGSKPRFRLPVW